jgi:threonine dehydrogenase-like Zn-dependent dehydrogenase
VAGGEVWHTSRWRRQWIEHFANHWQLKSCPFSDQNQIKSWFPPRLGECVVVMGVGGLGHLAIQFAKAMGLHVAAVDVRADRLALARQAGASLTVNAITENPVETEIGGAHGVLITAPSLSAFRQGVGMTRRRGTWVLVELPPGEFPSPVFDIVLKRIAVRGSRYSIDCGAAKCMVAWCSIWIARRWRSLRRP